MSPEEAADAYIAAWNAPEAAKVHELTSSCFTSDAAVVGVNETLSGPAEIAAWIMARQPGIRLNKRISAVDAHHGWLRFDWEFETISGEIGNGTDVGRQAVGGELDLLIAFAPLNLDRL